MELKAKYRHEKWDLHAHTCFSDGIYNIEDSILKRISVADVIGISDHFRMIDQKNELEYYCKVLESYKDYYSFHPESNIKVIRGIEIYLEDVTAVFNRSLEKSLDYFIIEYFEDYKDQQSVLESILSFKKHLDDSSSNIDIILAHPDFETWFQHLKRSIGVDTMLTALQENNIALEINCSMSYFNEEADVSFRQMASRKHDPVILALKNNKSIMSIGTDAHDYKDELWDYFTDVYNYFITMK